MFAHMGAFDPIKQYCGSSVGIYSRSLYLDSIDQTHVAIVLDALACDHHFQSLAVTIDDLPKMRALVRALSLTTTLTTIDVRIGSRATLVNQEWDEGFTALAHAVRNNTSLCSISITLYDVPDERRHNYQHMLLEACHMHPNVQWLDIDRLMTLHYIHDLATCKKMITCLSDLLVMTPSLKYYVGAYHTHKFEEHDYVSILHAIGLNQTIQYLVLSGEHAMASAQPDDTRSWKLSIKDFDWTRYPQGNSPLRQTLMLNTTVTWLEMTYYGCKDATHYLRSWIGAIKYHISIQLLRLDGVKAHTYMDTWLRLAGYGRVVSPQYHIPDTLHQQITHTVCSMRVWM